jgi:DNA-binding winged helix-turn-helix (wHTH) protein
MLAMLLKRPGEVITRQEIQQRLWPNDTVVEFETSINSAVRRLRGALGDSAEQPRYIETLVRRGYRWKTSVVWTTPLPTEAQ